MTAAQYIKKLNEQKSKAEKRFLNLSFLEQSMIDAGYEFLLSSLDLTDDKVFEVPGDLTSLMDDFTQSILDVAKNSKSFNNAFDSYLTDLKVINQNIFEFQKDFNGIILTKKGLKPVQDAVIGEVIDQYKGNGLNTHFAAPLRNLMYGNILGGMNQKEAKQYLKDYIAGGNDESGKLKSYLTQTAQQGVDSFSGVTNMKIVKDFKMTGYIISGSLIETSSKQCIYAIETSDNGYLSFEDWKKVLTIARENPKAKLIDGTTVENLPLNKLHWGCRHEFSATIKQAA